MSTIKDYMGMNPQPDGVGIEIELEGEEQLPETVHDWTSVREGSLRGYGIEYITNGPVALNNLEDRLVALKEVLDDYEINEDCPRTSVHVHVNHQDRTPTQVWSSMILYWLLENPLTSFCGDGRVGNLFCLRLKDAEGILKTCKSDISTLGLFSSFRQDHVKYAGQNVGNVRRLGTLEYRSMRGTLDTELITEWSKSLVKIRDRASEFSSPAAMLDHYFGCDRKDFVKSCLTDYVHEHIAEGDYMDGVDENLARLCGLAYCTDWTKYEKKMDKRYARNTDTRQQNPRVVRRAATLAEIEAAATIPDNLRRINQLTMPTWTIREEGDAELG